MNNLQPEIQNNLYAFYDQVALCQGIYAERKERWSVISNQPGIWPRLIYRVCEDLPETKSSGELFEKVQLGHYPEVLIATDENIRQTDPFLRGKGFYPFMAWKGMVREYTEKTVVPILPQTIEIVNLKLPEDKERWAKIVSTELIAPTQFDQSLIERLDARPGVELFLLKHDGIGMSTILTYDSGHSTGLYMIATDRSAQRKGFAHLLVQQIVWQITQKSKKPIILHATQKGEGLYAKSGFLPYNQFFLYRYLNQQP